MHSLVMRTHAQIIRDAGGADNVRVRLPNPPSPHTVRSWVARSSIPAEWWSDMVAGQVATLDELAQAAAQRKQAVS